MYVHVSLLDSLSPSICQDGRGEGIATEAAWDHVQSLYQSTSSTCLFGKNNIMVQPVRPLLCSHVISQIYGGASGHCTLVVIWRPIGQKVSPYSCLCPLCIEGPTVYCPVEICRLNIPCCVYWFVQPIDCNVKHCIFQNINFLYK